MEHDKEFYTNLAKVIERLLSNKNLLMSDEGKNLAGDYWGSILNFFRENRGTYLLSGGCVGINDRVALKSLLAECKNTIDNIEKTEKDRLLNNKGTKVAIWCGIGGLIVSIVSLVLSIIAISK